MKLAFFVSILLLPIISILAADSCKNFGTIDHTDKWPASSIRNQGPIGSCHIFAATALVEAQYYLLTGSYIDLAERDLFYQHLFPSGNEKDIKNEAHSFSSLAEGGWSEKDLNRFQENGICQEDKLPYEDLLNGEAQEIYSQLKSFKVEKNLDEIAEEFSLKKHGSCLNERKNIRNKFSDYKIETLRCGRDIKCTKEAILTYLKCNPLAVGVASYGSMLQPKWLEKILYTPGAAGLHALVIAGYDCTRDEFIMRNSWGASDYDRVDANKLIAGLTDFSILHNGYIMPDEKYLRCPNELISYIKGDINGDKMVDEKDSDEIYSYLWKYKLVEDNLVYFKLDLNGDGVIDLADAKELIELVYKVEPEYSLGLFPTGKVKKVYQAELVKQLPEKVKKGPWPKLFRRQRELKVDPRIQLADFEKRTIEYLNRELPEKRKVAIAMNFVETLNNAYDLGVISKNEYVSKIRHFVSAAREVGFASASELFSNRTDWRFVNFREGRSYYQSKNSRYNNYQ
jgi:hypothetical protein